MSSRNLVSHPDSQIFRRLSIVDEIVLGQRHVEKWLTGVDKKQDAEVAPSRLLLLLLLLLPLILLLLLLLDPCPWPASLSLTLALSSLLLRALCE